MSRECPITVFAVVQLLKELAAASLPLPPPPPTTGDAVRDGAAALAYLAELAQHAKRDERLRAPGVFASFLSLAFDTDAEALTEAGSNLVGTALAWLLIQPDTDGGAA